MTQLKEALGCTPPTPALRGWPHCLACMQVCPLAALPNLSMKPRHPVPCQGTPTPHSLWETQGMEDGAHRTPQQVTRIRWALAAADSGHPRAAPRESTVRPSGHLLGKHEAMGTVRPRGKRREAGGPQRQDKEAGGPAASLSWPS